MSRFTRRSGPSLVSALSVASLWFGCSSSSNPFSDPSGQAAGSAGAPAAGAGAGMPPSGGTAGASAGNGSSGSGGTQGGSAGSGANGGATAGSGADGTSGSTASGGTSAGGSDAGGSSAGGSSAGDGSSGEGSGGNDGSCMNDENCAGANEYCKKQSCDAAEGTCTARASACTGMAAAFAPLCGCNGVTYYSECVAEREGANIAARGECTHDQGAPCTRDGGGESCEPASERARCYRPRNSCNGDSPTEGLCWVLPDECPEEPATTRYCGGTSGGARCTSLCEVVDLEDSFYRDAPACANR